MHILYLNGDLHDQISEYIFLRHCELIHNEEILVDDTHYYSQFGYDEFELSKIFPNIKLKMLKDEYNEEKWQEMVDTCVNSNSAIQVPNILCDEGLDFKVVADLNFYNAIPDFNNLDAKGRPTINFSEKYDFRNESYKVVAQFLAENGHRARPFRDMATGKPFEHIFYAGIWKHDLFPKSIEKQLKDELAFPPFKEEQNIQDMENILLKNGAIGIYVNSIEILSEQNGEKVINLYSDAIRKIKREVSKTNGTPRFFFFSDDPETCENNIDKFRINPTDEIFYIKFDDNNISSDDFSLDFGFDDDNIEDSYRQIQLMTGCDYLISYGNYDDVKLAGIISKKTNQIITLNKIK